MTSRKPKRFAEGTSVAIDKSRAEVETLLERHGASHVAIMRSPEESIVVFQIGVLRVRRAVQVPTQGSAEARDREHRRRWRALVLILKAKLEMITGGESTMEREFLADMMLPNGETVESEFLPKLLQALQANKQPRLALTSGDPK